MDLNLIQRVVDFHGNELLDLLESDQTLSSFPVPSAIEFRAPEGDPNDEDFKSKLNRFLSRKGDLLYAQHSPPIMEVVKNENAVQDYYAVMPPVEAFMGISPSQCRKHFYQCVRKNDIFTGVVTAVQESGLIVTLLSMDYGKARDIDQLRITGFCPLREVPRLYAHESPLDAFTIKDKVRGIVLQVDPDKEKMVISLQTSALPPGVENVKMGLIADEDMPVHYKHLTKSSGKPFEEMLTAELGFSNPACVSFLCRVLGLSDEEPPSFMRGLNRLKIPESETAEGLRKIQTTKWALKSVAAGVSHFKDGRYVEAVQHFNKALEIDSGNVEAFVARGALYANNENYSKAIVDFEKALALNPTHHNARKYLCETLVVHGRITEDQGEKELAMQFYERAVELKPDLIEARDCISHLKQEEAYQRQQDLEQRRHSYQPDNEVIDLRNNSPEPDSSARNPENPVFKETADTLRKLIKEDREQGRLKKKKKKRSRSGDRHETPEYEIYGHQPSSSSIERRRSKDSYSESKVERRQSKESCHMEEQGWYAEYEKKRQIIHDGREAKRETHHREERDSRHFHTDDVSPYRESVGQGHDPTTMTTRSVALSSSSPPRKKQKYDGRKERDLVSSHVAGVYVRDREPDYNEFHDVDYRSIHEKNTEDFSLETNAWHSSTVLEHRQDGQKMDIYDPNLSPKKIFQKKEEEKRYIYTSGQEQDGHKGRGLRSRSRSVSPRVRHQDKKASEKRDEYPYAETRRVTITGVSKKSESIHVRSRSQSHSPSESSHSLKKNSDYQSYKDEELMGQGHGMERDRRRSAPRGSSESRTSQVKSKEAEKIYKLSDYKRTISIDKAKDKYSDEGIYRQSDHRRKRDADQISERKTRKDDRGKRGRSGSGSRSRSSSKSGQRIGNSSPRSMSKTHSGSKFRNKRRSLSQSSSSSSNSTSSSRSTSSSSGSSDSASSVPQSESKPKNKLAARRKEVFEKVTPGDRNQHNSSSQVDKQNWKSNQQPKQVGKMLDTKSKAPSSFTPRSLLVKQREPPKKPGKKAVLKSNPSDRSLKSQNRKQFDASEPMPDAAVVKEVKPQDPRKSRWDSPTSEEEEKGHKIKSEKESKETLEDMEKFLKYLKNQKKGKDTIKK